MEMVMAVICAGMGVILLVAAAQLAQAGRGLRRAAKGLADVEKGMRGEDATDCGKAQDQSEG